MTLSVQSAFTKNNSGGLHFPGDVPAHAIVQIVLTVRVTDIGLPQKTQGNKNSIRGKYFKMR
ncbi:hypothetical protein L873DRAFT_1810392 [Choiromyces venosus 120613-1]|uniref:Uncharacterized protein n=1 Tax=Choiromyces venosus 120613-1 TaxID=1336337 RepID=A0A3N4JJD3_9PEZI|nr:hypothetical protein L873DRAFT_1810392 [Choiromyces venosus 120613-1]